jgi:hypothetical protein
MYISCMYSLVLSPQIAQERLIEGLKPALKHIISALARQYNQLRPLVKYNEEIFSAMLYFLQSHYLSEYGESIDEVSLYYK